jgi:DNA topoisomerase IB
MHGTRTTPLHAAGIIHANGLTTLHGEHVAATGSTIRFQFRSKEGKEQRVNARDRRLACVIRQCQELGGEELFHYVDDNEEAQLITSDDVNEYLRESSGQDFTAKDFRTWAGTLVEVLNFLRRIAPWDDSRPTRRRRSTTTGRDRARTRVRGARDVA